MHLGSFPWGTLQGAFESFRDRVGIAIQGILAGCRVVRAERCDGERVHSPYAELR